MNPRNLQATAQAARSPEEEALYQVLTIEREAQAIIIEAEEQAQQLVLAAQERATELEQTARREAQESAQRATEQARQQALQTAEGIRRKADLEMSAWEAAVQPQLDEAVSRVVAVATLCVRTDDGVGR